MKFKIIFFNEIRIYFFCTTALHCATVNDNLEIVHILMQKPGIDINITDSMGKKPIDYAKSDEIKQLLSK